MTEMSNAPVNGPREPEYHPDPAPIAVPLNKTIIHHAVRQVMMNEMGLSRAYIKQQADELIQDAVKKEMEKIINGNAIFEIVKKTLDSKLWLTGRNTGIRTVEEMVYTEVQAQVKAQVAKSVEVSFKIRS